MKHRVAFSGAVAWIASGGVAHACSVCFGPVEDPMIDGTRLAILFLLGLTYLVVGGGITLAVLHHRRRIRAGGPPPTPPARHRAPAEAAAGRAAA